VGDKGMLLIKQKEKGWNFCAREKSVFHLLYIRLKKKNLDGTGSRRGEKSRCGSRRAKKASPNSGEGLRRVAATPQAEGKKGKPALSDLSRGGDTKTPQAEKRNQGLSAAGTQKEVGEGFVKVLLEARSWKVREFSDSYLGG